MSHTPFRDLLDTRGVHEVCELRGRIGFMAYHGGSLEEMTDVIARRAAEASDASYYGVLQPPDLNWHIPSHKVSPAESPTLKAFLEHVHVAITIHGFGRDGMWTTLLLGGQNRPLAEHLATHLRPKLPQYTVETKLRRIPKELRGMHGRVVPRIDRHAARMNRDDADDCELGLVLLGEVGRKVESATRGHAAVVREEDLHRRLPFAHLRPVRRWAGPMCRACAPAPAMATADGHHERGPMAPVSAGCPGTDERAGRPSGW